MKKPVYLKSFLLLLCVFLVANSGSASMAWPWKWNQVNKAGNRQGKWRAFYEHKPEQLMYRGRFKDGQERGTWRTYSENGTLERLEKYEPRHKRIRTIFYHPNGKVSHTGMAYLFEEKNMLMYKWHGDWHYYDAAGNWLGWKSFSCGQAASAEPVQAKKPADVK
ncbi:hypothetical protein EFA69_15510 [Rufibacter immobilis]|uniref:Toxin-antitoxin system YwqK family antitoxin n=1 Tax=Rufibacter immobilis TaxID=1348778 RepID=A0A3M9MPS9_9BACT|nr:hypothetical protein [Rufibacter immobilis]RNI27532.1 hypothetical protein EFA69_15510 [Rufibacter immobilis]